MEMFCGRDGFVEDTFCVRSHFEEETFCGEMF